MKETNLSESELRSFIDTSDSEVKEKFMSYTARTENGSSKDIRTPFYGGTDKDNPTPRSEILSKWMPKLTGLQDSMLGLYEYEMDMAEKVGPLSIQQPLEERLDTIHEYYEGITLPSEPLDKAAIDRTVKFMNPIKGLRIRNQQKTVEEMDLVKAAGAPYLGLKHDRLSQTVPCVSIFYPEKEPYHTYQTLANGTTWPSVALLGWRGQEHGPNDDDVKQRALFMMSFGDAVCELQWYQPYTQACQRFNLMPPWVGETAVDESMTGLLKQKAADQLVLCTDFTAFDQHFGPAMQQAAFDVFDKIMSTDPVTRNWLETVYWTKYYIPLIAGNKIYTGRHGMSSGSGGTSGDETTAHKVLQFEAALRDKAELHPNSMCIGDDGVLTYPGITKEAVTEYYSSHGLDMNVEKQEASERQAIFLRRWYDREYCPSKDGICRGVYPTTRAIGRLSGQERSYDKWDSSMVTLRYLSIIENCKWHPLFDDFVEFCIKGDKYRLGLDIPGFYSNIRQIASRAMNMMPDFMSYNQRMGLRNKDFREGAGIEEWRVVRYILSNYSPREKRKVIY